MSLRQLSIANVLCPTDFSDPAGRALERASMIAAWFRAKLTVMHVIPYMPDSQSRPLSLDDADGERGPALVQSRSEVEQELKRAIQSHAKSGAETHWEVAEGEPWRRIEERALTLPADMVVLGNEGRTGWERLLIGSTTEKVMRRLGAPVLAVRGSGKAPKGPLFHRIVCALDLTASSRETIDLAFALAEENLAEVVLLHVLDVGPLFGRLPGAESRREAIVAAEDQAKAVIGALAERSWTFCRCEALVTNGTAWREILRVATGAKADLIVVGAHGPGALDASFLGSTADQVIRHADCSVLLAKPRNRAIR